MDFDPSWMREELTSIKATLKSIQDSIASNHNEYQGRITSLERVTEAQELLLKDLLSKSDSLRDSALNQINRVSSDMREVMEWRKNHNEFATRQLEENKLAFEGVFKIVNEGSDSHEGRLKKVEARLNHHTVVISIITFVTGGAAMAFINHLLAKGVP